MSIAEQLIDDIYNETIDCYVPHYDMEVTINLINKALRKQRAICASVITDYLIKHYLNIPGSQYKEIENLILNAEE